MQKQTNYLPEHHKLKVQLRYRLAIERFGLQPQALFWSSREIQEKRFEVLMEVLSKPRLMSKQPWRLLDVGCGFSDLSNFLNRNGYFPEYLGLDVSSDVLQGARELYKNVNLQQGELIELQYPDNEFDYVMLSGTLSEVIDTQLNEYTIHHLDSDGSESIATGKDDPYAMYLIEEMYRVSSKGVAFNLLDARHAWNQNSDDLQCFFPHEIVEFCQVFADKVELIEGYLENDFTIFLHKKSLSKGLT